VIQGDRAVSLYSGNGPAYNLGSLRGGQVMRLQHEAPQTTPQEIPGQIYIIGAPIDYIGCDMNL
jgi:hypothetical protein